MYANKSKNAFLILSSKFYNHYEEALILASTAGYEIVGTKRFRGGKRITDGLIEIVKNNKKELNFDTVIYYGDIEPSSVFKLEKETKIRVIDRVQLILEIFALHAGSKEALLQIEMARIKHELPIIREYIRRTKLGELAGFLGPGRYGIDTYKKQLTSRLSKIKRDLEDLRKTEQERLKRRKELGMINIPIVGYASAGKTSLFNLITGESKPIGPEYFTTLFPKHKTVNYNGLKLAFVDTVGFIRDVPPEVIEAFYSTLEEVAISDIIVFVIDITENENDIKEKILAGTDILKKLNAINKPIIFALNKIDEIDKNRIYDKIEFVKKTFPNDKIIPISAKKNIGIDKLLSEISNISNKSSFMFNIY